MKTVKLTSARIDRMQIPPAFCVAALVFILAALLASASRLGDSTSAAVPTPALAPIIILASPLPVVPPTTVPIQVAAVLPRWVVCYDQPVNGAVLGPIPAPDASAIVARYGATWVMTPWNGGYCWLRAADVGMPDVADLQPAPQPQVVYVSAPAPAYAAPTPEPYTVASEPQPTPVWATSAPVRKEDFQEPNHAATCAFVGCLPGR